MSFSEEGNDDKEKAPYARVPMPLPTPSPRETQDAQSVASEESQQAPPSERSLNMDFEHQYTPRSKKIWRIRQIRRLMARIGKNRKVTISWRAVTEFLIGEDKAVTKFVLSQLADRKNLFKIIPKKDKRSAKK